MIKKTFLANIKKNLDTYQKERNVIINQSRQILQAAKKSIFAWHRLDQKQAKNALAEAEKVLSSLGKTYNKASRLKFEGSFKAAVEEYVEAKLFSLVMNKKNIEAIKLDNIGPEEYIGGLCDLTGELVRQAVLQATKGNFKELERYRSIAEEVVGFLLTLYLTGYQRQKFDDAKRNLKRLEQIIYEVRLRG
ncbi:MAG: hypothetical protein UV78_C0073G0011 [Parcubacteria group bacterium GW2011_GWA2_43_17]|nr:MAG: hypothetical protein UV78_C0073G0011 [Parcubacteria group bacterium GW2011_GWA2_43_17]KKT94379.1 MAG: hypothetical protein UW91_C0002G0023 [Parcubacteria group bacterium GW2011_GWF2_45_11]KKT98701.1 MAG: hypothetical protein UW98_C0005G0021 [Parcubacteria group bacterium GW2011_GWC2_45_15]OGY93631.1 MAG: hypothetical protein A2260_03135 [Candidatus Komeilibacteria bacterium RIFOXYA2_FULL_45_9]OGY94587.1 MAG: hypothetical protein A3J95_04005 [Candidatus Komeilibacteria bacterium RIFOXYC2